MVSQFTIHVALAALIERNNRDGGVSDRVIYLVANMCDDPECSSCSRLLCPYGEELHFHHDGCPACEAEK